MFYAGQALSYFLFFIVLILLCFFFFFFFPSFFFFNIFPFCLLWIVLSVNLHKFPHSLPTFHHLQRLSIKSCKDSNQSGKNCGKPTEKTRVNLRRQRNVRGRRRRRRRRRRRELSSLRGGELWGEVFIFTCFPFPFTFFFFFFFFFSFSFL